METPNCNYCGSDFSNQTTIYLNVKDTQHNLVECNNCHLRFYSPRIPFTEYLYQGYGTNPSAKAEAERMFTNASFTPVQDPDVQKHTLKAYYDRIVISKLFNYRNDITNLYEIGGSVGWLSYFIKQMYPLININGCEINKYAVQWANSHFGLKYDYGIFLNKEIKENYYDVCLALDYIEHTFTPFDDLKKMNKLLKPSGIIFMKTFLEELDINRTMVAPIGHSHHFFGHVLKKMIEECGFTIIEWVLAQEQVIIIGKKNE